MILGDFMSQSFCDSDQYAQDLEGVVSCRPASVGPEIWNNSSQCTMGKLKNVVKSSQLLQIISLSILIQKFRNFPHSSLNSPISQINTNIKNKYLKNQKKIQKTCWGCFLKSRLVSKKTSCKKKSFL